MSKLIGSLEKQLTDKGEEINAYMEKHQIQVVGEGNHGRKQGEKQNYSSHQKGVGLVMFNVNFLQDQVN